MDSDPALSCAQAILLGCYVMGRLATAERDHVREHLATCAACERELADLHHIPRYLDLLSSDDIAAFDADG